MTEGKFPKNDGEVFYASEINHFFNLYADVKTYNLAVTTTSASLDFSSIAYKYTILIKNIGYVDCYFSLTSSATVNDMILPAGTELKLSSAEFDNLSAITSANSTELTIAIFVGLNNKTGYKSDSEVKKLSVTATSSNVSFTDTMSYKDILIVNSGVNRVYVQVGTTATTGGYILEPRDSLTVMADKSTFSAICDSGKTSEIRVLGVF